MRVLYNHYSATLNAATISTVDDHRTMQWWN